MMNAIITPKYGTPDVLVYDEVVRPIPKENEVLVKVKAASANPLDWHILKGFPLFMRLAIGIFRPKFRILGADIAGEVESVGPDVTQFQPGDAVYSDLYNYGLGGFAEYVCAEQSAFAHKPENLTFQEAASVPVAALTALNGLRNFGQIRPGQKVLINGSSGGVGTFSIQIAKAYGADVTAVCSTRNIEMVKEIGADWVIDYTVDDFTKLGEEYDLILDNVGNRSARDLARCLKPNGNCAVIGFSTFTNMVKIIFQGSLLTKRTAKTIKMLDFTSTVEDLIYLKELIEAGKIKPVIDRQYDLPQTSNALSYLQRGHAQGKVIIDM